MHVRQCVLILIAHIFVCAFVFRHFHSENISSVCVGCFVLAWPLPVAHGSLSISILPFPFHFEITNVSRLSTTSGAAPTRAQNLNTHFFDVFTNEKKKRADTHLARK